MGTGGGMGAREGIEGEKEAVGKRMGMGKGGATAVHVRCKGAAPAMRGGPRGIYHRSHTDQELT